MTDVIIAGERENGQTTLETFNLGAETHLVMATHRAHVDGSGTTYVASSLSMPITDDPALREQLVRNFATALGVTL